MYKSTSTYSEYEYHQIGRSQLRPSSRTVLDYSGPVEFRPNRMRNEQSLPDAIRMIVALFAPTSQLVKKLEVLGQFYVDLNNRSLRSTVLMKGLQCSPLKTPPGCYQSVIAFTYGANWDHASDWDIKPLYCIHHETAGSILSKFQLQNSCIDQLLSIVKQKLFVARNLLRIEQQYMTFYQSIIWRLD